MASLRCPLALPVVLLAAVGCGDPVSQPDGSRDTIAPVVTDLQPAPLEQGVPVSAVVTIRFSEPINPATVGTGSFLVRRGSDTVLGAYAFGDSTASFVPDVNLALQASYAVTVTRGIRDPAGNQLARDTAWAFQTGSQGTPAVIRSARRGP